MDVTLVKIDFSELTQTLQGNWDAWPWQRENEIIVLQTKFKHVDWTLWIALPPKGMWWGLAPVLGFSLEPWRQHQIEDSKVFKMFKMELKEAMVPMESIPHTLIPYGHTDKKGHSAPIGNSAASQNILLFCSWLTPTSADSGAFVSALTESIAQLEEWNLRPAEGDPEREKLLALNAIRDKPISFLALEKSGLERDVCESDIMEYIHWLNKFEMITPNDFSAAQLRNSSVDIWSWKMFDIDSRPLLKELIIARAEFLQRLEPPSFYWQTFGLRALQRNGYPYPKTQQAKIFAKELEERVDIYIHAICRRYPLFKYDLLASN